jgi:hypothetical protein
MLLSQRKLRVGAVATPTRRMCHPNIPPGTRDDAKNYPAGVGDGVGEGHSFFSPPHPPQLARAWGVVKSAKVSRRADVAMRNSGRCVMAVCWWDGLGLGDSTCRTHDFKGFAAGLDQVRPSGRGSVQKKFQKNVVARGDPFVPQSKSHPETRSGCRRGRVVRGW